MDSFVGLQTSPCLASPRSPDWLRERRRQLQRRTPPITRCASSQHRPSTTRSRVSISRPALPPADVRERPGSQWR
jgi:hypothetical protein